MEMFLIWKRCLNNHDRMLERLIDRFDKKIYGGTGRMKDLVEVIRCKDCKYWQDNNDGYPHEECRWGHGETPDANDFCSYGERKEGAN